MRKASLRRTHRQVIYLNDKELAAVKEYCDRFGVKELSLINISEPTRQRCVSRMPSSA